MKRREFLTGSLAAAGAAGLQFSAAAQQGSGGATASAGAREYYELRRYDLRNGPMVAEMNRYLKDVALPAYNRAGLSPVGVFTPVFGPETPSIYLLLRHPNLESLATIASRLAADHEYVKAAAPHRDLPATNPAYVRMDNSLHVAFEGMPQLEVPSQTKASKPRVFELRIYESHSRAASRKKMEMFNTLGEIPLFRRVGLTPVFFGETIVGERLPKFTYLLVFDDLAAREKNWDVFRNDPEWKKMSSTPGYSDADIVSNIQSIILRPTAYSEI